MKTACLPLLLLISCSKPDAAPTPTASANPLPPSAAASAVSPTALPAEDPNDRAEMAAGAKELLAEYKNNEVRADGQYKGKTVAVEGIVGEVKKDIANEIYVIVGTGAALEVPKLQCFARKGEDQAFAALNKGDTVLLMAKIDGLMMNVIGRDCTIAASYNAADLCAKVQKATGLGECIKDGAAIGYGADAVAVLSCVAPAQYQRIANKYSTSERPAFAGSERLHCFSLISSSDEKKPPNAAFVAKLRAAFATL